MNFRSWPLLLASLTLTAWGTVVGQAAPWTKTPFKKVDADPRRDYPLTENNGPWMIMVSTFSGEGAETQARELVQELRTKFKVPAYLYQKKFDFSKSVEGRGVDRYGGPQSMRYQRHEAVVEIAVLVGDYASVNDLEAQKLLKRLKFSKPAALDVEKRGSSSQTLGALRTIQRAIQPDGSEEKQKGPMGHAFITTNPLLPPDYFVPKGLDKFVIDMNKGVKFTLLDCPGRYSVKVATFTGQVILNQKAIEQIEKGSAMKSRLADAAEKAHKLTEALRAKGVPAYEFHDRYQSIVTIGSFNSVGSKRADGKIEINPAIHALMEKYSADKKTVAGQAAPQVGAPKSESSIAFDVQAVPVEVPRRSISADYNRTADGR